MHPTPTLPLLRGGGKIILVYALNKGGLAGGEFNFCKSSNTGTANFSFCQYPTLKTC